jgi:hypothetical protein
MAPHERRPDVRDCSGNQRKPAKLLSLSSQMPTVNLPTAARITAYVANSIPKRHIE